MSQLNEKRERRNIRYTLLLAPSELDLAKKLAAREFRNLPDFFRSRIGSSLGQQPVTQSQDAMV